MKQAVKKKTAITRPSIKDIKAVLGLVGKDKNDLTVSVKVVYDTMYRREHYKDLNDDEFYNVVWEQIKEINKEFPQYKHIKKLILTDVELIKTTTNKTKRNEEMKLILGEK